MGSLINKREKGGNTMSEKAPIIKKAVEILRREGIRVFFKKVLSYSSSLGLKYRKLCIPILPFALLKIKYLNKKKLNLNEWVNISYKFFLLIRPWQIQEEILELLRILDERKPKIIIEIGLGRGGTFFLFSRVASEDATLINIDLPGGKLGGGFPNWIVPLYKAFRLPKQKLHLIRADSHNQKTLEKLKAILNGRKIDFLFIDGDHTYRGVKKDFEMYSPLVKESGIIAFHDIVGYSPETGCEVSRFWEEIKEKYEHQEIVKDWAQSWAGIGIIHKSK